jgi:hypothetical protein
MIKPGEPTGSKENLRATQILCAGLMGGVSIFAIMISVLNLTKGPVMDEEGLSYKNIFLYVAVGIAVICIFSSHILYNKKLAIVKNASDSLDSKLNQYRTALILYMAPCEGAALFSVIILFITGNFIVLLITGVMLGIMFTKFPFAKKVINELNLDWKEQQELI